MVWESWYWKLRLKDLVSEIEKLAVQPDASELDISNLEIATFTGFFLIRKLIEAKTKLSHATENQQVACEVAPKKTGTPLVDVMNRFHTHELYELDGFNAARFPLRRICNIFVHSAFLWMVYDVDGYLEGEGIITGVHLTSTYDKEKLLYCVSIEEILRLFRSVIDDDMTRLEMYRDPSTNEMKVKKG
ncbi:hypothetical protein [Erythrobacter aureus]|uniref:hypothetical protein n=1 Tax=Erythrobacter aureus TaxID=2182384 RepID=UPI003A919D1C